VLKNQLTANFLEPYVRLKIQWAPVWFHLKVPVLPIGVTGVLDN